MAAVIEQLPDRAVAERFVAVDLARELTYIADHYDNLQPAIGVPGRRHTQHEPETVALVHLFADLRDDDVIVVYHVDIWVSEPPREPET